MDCVLDLCGRVQRIAMDGTSGVPYIPPDPTALLEEFRKLLEGSGRTLVHYRSPSRDLSVLRLSWLITPSGRHYDEYAFFRLFDRRPFRQALRVICDRSTLSGADLAFLGAEEWRFLEDQEFLKKTVTWDEREPQTPLTDDTFHLLHTWSPGSAVQNIPNIGRTLEWYVAEWFRKEYYAVACHGVITQELTSGDLDVVAFKDGRSFFVECKSAPYIEEQKLRFLLQRSQDFHPDMTLLLIDTESGMSIEARTKQLCQILNLPSEGSRYLLRGKTVCYRIAVQNLYVANVGTSIASTLAAILQLYDAIDGLHKPKGV